jgi:cupin fold WbuC family metalloprotein
MIITQAVLDKLTEQAKASPRLRMNCDLRNSEADTSQGMLNAIELGSILPIHRHRKTSETVVCLRGRHVWEFFAEQSSEAERYDDLDRICTDRIELSPSGPIVALNVPIGQWHTVKAIESGSVILEMKDGPYEPLGEEDILK